MKKLYTIVVLLIFTFVISACSSKSSTSTVVEPTDQQKAVEQKNSNETQKLVIKKYATDISGPIQSAALALSEFDQLRKNVSSQIIGTDVFLASTREIGSRLDKSKRELELIEVSDDLPDDLKASHQSMIRIVGGMSDSIWGILDSFEKNDVEKLRENMEKLNGFGQEINKHAETLGKYAPK